MNVHLDEAGTIPDVQSAYRHHHSTETALTIVVADIFLAADAGDLSAISLLDLSAAFDTVDHSIMLQRLRTNHHIDGFVLD